MILQQASAHTLGPLSELLSSLEVNQYSQPLEILSGSSIGAHVRHILEFYTCLMNGIKADAVNYDDRERNYDLENNLEVAISLINEINLRINEYKVDMELNLKVFPSNSNESIFINTNFYRELAYNIEHCIHHLAIIKIGVLSNFPVTLPDHFGVAYSTVKFKEKINTQASI